jgi:hypothetical protein
MANNAPIRIPVMLDKPRHFQLDLAAVMRWEGLTDKPMFSNRVWRHFKKREDMAMMLWCLLVGDDPELKPGDIIQMFKDKKINPETTLPGFIQLLNDAWVEAITNTIGGDKHGNLSR